MTTSRRRRILHRKRPSDELELSDLSMQEQIMLTSGPLWKYRHLARIQTLGELVSFYERYREAFNTMATPQNYDHPHYVLFHRPGCRAWAWWMCETGGPPPEYDRHYTQVKELRKLGALSSEEVEVLQGELTNGY